MSGDPSTLVDRAQAAIKGVQQAVQAYLDVISDEGEPEVLTDCAVLYASKGMAEHGIFERANFLIPERSGTIGFVGMVELAHGRLQHHLHCGSGEG